MGREKPHRRPSPDGHGQKVGSSSKVMGRVQFRVTREQRAELEAEADKRGLSVGEVARQRCFADMGRKRPPRALEPVTSGFVRGVAAVAFRLTQDQLDVLELEALRWCTTAGEVARRRCFTVGAAQEAA